MYSPEIEALFDLVAQLLPDNTTGAITPARVRQVLGALLSHIGVLPTPNTRRGGPFAVTAYDATVPGYQAGVSIMADIDDALICFGARLAVEQGPDGTNIEYVPVYDTAGSLRINKDGFFGPDTNIPARWVPDGSPEVTAAAYATFPAGYVFATEQLIRAYLPGVAAQQFANRRVPGGPAAGPTAALLPTAGNPTGTDPNWAFVGREAVPVGVSQKYVDEANAVQQVEIDLLEDRMTAAENDADALDMRVDALELAVRVRYANGAVGGFATVQQAANALAATGGGTIFSDVDIPGPLVLSGPVSLRAPGRKVFLDSGTGDSLTLNNHSGVIDCELVTRDGTGTGYGLVVNGGTPVVKANVFNSRGYNAVFSQNSFLVLTGNSDLVHNPTLGNGERITVLQVGGTLLNRGRVTFDSPVFGEALVCFGGTVDHDGQIIVKDKGAVARNQGGTLRLRGQAKTKDRGVKLASGKTDIFLSIDTREAPNATADNAPLVVVRNGATPPDSYVTLHVGTELLAPAGIASIVNGNPALGIDFPVQVVGSLVQTALPGSGIAIAHQTLNSTLSAGEDPRKDLSTDSLRGRTVNIRREGKCHISAITLAENAASAGFQVLQNNAAVAPARTGTPAAVAAAINADIDAMTNYFFYTIRQITVPTVSANASVVLVTVLPA